MDHHAAKTKLSHFQNVRLGSPLVFFFIYLKASVTDILLSKSERLPLVFHVNPSSSRFCWHFPYIQYPYHHMLIQQRPLYNKNIFPPHVNPVIYDFSNTSGCDTPASNIPQSSRYTAECYFVCHLPQNPSRHHHHHPTPRDPHHHQNVKTERAFQASQFFFTSCGNLVDGQNEEGKKKPNETYKSSSKSMMSHVNTRSSLRMFWTRKGKGLHVSSTCWDGSCPR